MLHKGAWFANHGIHFRSQYHKNVAFPGRDISSLAVKGLLRILLYQIKYSRKSHFKNRVLSIVSSLLINYQSALSEEFYLPLTIIKVQIDFFP